jgi:hypothetical protein
MIRRRDPRYSLRLEFCGYIRARHVVRFCGAWVGSAATRHEAAELQRQHAAQRAAEIARLRTLPPLHLQGA